MKNKGHHYEKLDCNAHRLDIAWGPVCMHVAAPAVWTSGNLHNVEPQCNLEQASETGEKGEELTGRKVARMRSDSGEKGGLRWWLQKCCKLQDQSQSLDRIHPRNPADSCTFTASHT